MGAFDDHPNVTAHDSGGYTVHTDRGDIYVVQGDASGWGLYHGPDMAPVALRITDADSAVAGALCIPRERLDSGD